MLFAARYVRRYIAVYMQMGFKFRVVGFEPSAAMQQEGEKSLRNLRAEPRVADLLFIKNKKTFQFYMASYVPEFSCCNGAKIRKKSREGRFV